MPEYVLKSDGRVLRRPIEVTCPGETEIQIDDALIAAAGRSISRRISGLAELPSGRIGASVIDDAGNAYFTVVLESLRLNATIETRNGIVIPTFQKTGDFAVLEWTPPSDCKLCFMAYVRRVGAGTFEGNPFFLFALSGTGAAYQLPVPNLYDDCRICMGVDTIHGSSALGVVGQGVSQFVESKWNADLLGAEDRRKASESLFKFRPVAGGFVWVRTERPWYEYSKKVGSSILDHISL